MHYSRANFAYNFLNAIDTDHEAAWDVLVHEINEVLLNNTKQAEEALRKAGLRMHSNPTPKIMVELIHDHYYENKVLRDELTKLIMLRHKDELISEGRGAYDKLYNNAIGDPADTTDGENPVQVQEIKDATDKLVGVKPNVNNLSYPKEAVKGMLTDSLDQKEWQKNQANGGPSKRKLSKPQKIALWIGAAVIVGTIVVACWPKKQTQTS